ncbi:uncharacterized protein PpBr36_09398 [Pyricularia pennisetigena]|uniref:uncharacterized protein n=1 Tax=Pyricularia pennisetigena TaxID=1578925 RepID=UPI00115435DD|nr:uncharacterized protein PpBr36_09398 [Pyricularia pennisetigena]TLS22071.1 hypothetical protein PpBr36_09398 [Pyricularia pennisetigena]
MPPPPPPPRRPALGAAGASKEENVYIPNFISKRPFYAVDEGENTDYLEHQRIQKKQKDTAWYDRGKTLGPAATKYRKGACENCGAMTHKVKDCLSRPRAKGAKWTGRDIKADELVQEVRMGWDAKRDRWNGYDAREYQAVVEDYNKMEELRKEMQAKAAAESGKAIEDGDHYAETSDMSKHQPTSTRQLRLREDTAKYLLNLDLDSAKYDPKTRTIVDAGATNDKTAELYAEQGFLRQSGDAAEFEKAQRYAWEAQEKGGDTSLHLQANPTAGSYMRKKLKEEEDAKREERERQLREKYGGEETKVLPDAIRQMAVTESERYVEYDEIGLIKGGPKGVARSKYKEDIFHNNHTSVWGSWWSNFKWGYACCHSFVKNSYCTGEEGKAAWEAAERQRTGVGLLEPAGDAEDEGSREEATRPQEVETAATAKEKFKKRATEQAIGDVTEAELDEYRRKRTNTDDPMAQLLGRDELIS